jgi:hypothetical protein
VTPLRLRPLDQPETRFADRRDPVKSAKRRPGLAGKEELFRSTKVEALPIGLWPKLFSVTSNVEPGFNASSDSSGDTCYGAPNSGVAVPAAPSPERVPVHGFAVCRRARRSHVTRWVFERAILTVISAVKANDWRPHR